MIKENNISNIIIFSTILALSFLVVSLGYFFASKQYEMVEKEIKETKDKIINYKKENIKREAEAVINFIEFARKTYKNDDLQKYIKKYISQISFGENAAGYVFVYEIHNINGGDKFAKMIVHKNRADLLDKFISDSYEDTNGKQFRKIAMQGIRENGEAYVSYMYPKNGFDDFWKRKISYFKLYKPFGWVIVAGTYLDDVDVFLEQKNYSIKKKLKTDLIYSFLVFLIFLLIAIIFAIFLGKKIEQFFNNYKNQTKAQHNELKLLNKTLESRVKQEVEKRRQQEQILIQKSKFVALGEMISNIAHQWRQPLSQLSAILMTMKFKYLMNDFKKDEIETKSKQAEDLIEYMSRTIDDFRNFFLADKKKEIFSIKKSLKNVLNIAGQALNNHNINIEINIEKDAFVYGFEHLYEQVVLNIITNAKDIILEKQTQDAKIMINLSVNDEFAILNITDNGGGIEAADINEVFMPYYTTKEKGTGIGLYMSKIIIEDNMNGSLNVKNEKNGAKFEIKMKKEDDPHTPSQIL